MILIIVLSAVFAHQVVIVLASSQCGFRYVENPEIPGVCCDPVFDCPAGHQIVRCTQSFASDTCESCPAGYVQPDMISSTDTLEDTKCFVKIRDCHARDSVYSRVNENDCAGKNGCKCDTNNCYYDDYCVCNSIKPCGVNEELDPVKKKCVPCRDYRYKPTTGCAPCTMNKTAWIEAMERKSAVLTTAHKSPSITTSSSASSVSVSSNSNSANSNGNTDKPKTTGMEVVVVTNSSLSVGLVVENKQDELVNLKILIGILIPLMFITVIACIILYIKRGKLFCLNLVRHRNERRNVPAANGNVVRYNAVPPDVERNGNAIRDRNNVTESSLSTFPPIDSVPDQSDSVKQTAQCNHYAAEQNDSGPQSNHVIPYQSASLTPPQSSQFDTYGNDATPLVQPGNQPLRVKITPQTNIAANLQTPTPTRTSPSSDSSATIATPMDHDSHSEMVPSASPFQMYPAAHPLSGATYDGTRLKEVANVASVSPVNANVNIVKPLKNDSGCFSTATERLSSAAQSNNFRIRLPEEGENDTEVKQQDNYECNHDNSHEGS